jgi:hypothetical protein
MKIPLPLDDSQRPRVRQTSKAVFKSQYALEVMLVIAQEDRFYQSQIAQAVGCEASYVSEFLKHLAGVGLIESLTSEPGQIRKYYRRVDSPLWGSCVELAADLLPTVHPDVTRLDHRRADNAR